MHFISLGRGNANDIVISNPSVSTNHAQLEIDNHGKVFIKDFGSKNGTFVNGKKINEQHRLNAGDNVKLGDFSFDWQKALIGDYAVQQSIPAASSIGKSNGLVFWKVLSLFLATSFFAYFILVNPTGKKVVSTIFHNDTTTAENQVKKRKIRSYDLACLNEGNGADDMIKVGSEMQDDAINSSTKPFSIEDEMKVGDEVYKQTLEKYKLVNDAKIVSRIGGIFNRLVNTIGDSAKGFKYLVYVIESDEINAFTAGGKVFVTTGIINFVKSDDELACIIGHEIYHNELGHINKALRKEAALKAVFGDQLAQFAAMATSILTISFNQKDETDCDLHGLDLAADVGYIECSIILFWNRMSEKENGSEVEKFFRSHPYSKQRAHCIENHIKNNYNKTCN